VVKTLRAWAGLLVRAGTQFFANHAQKHAAAISYYVLFSIVPLVIFVVGIAGLVLGEQHEVRQDIVDEVVEGMRFGEPEGREEVEDAVNGIKGTGGGVAGLVALIGFMWGASSMLGAVRYSLNLAFDDFQTPRPYVPQKLIDLALVLGLAAVFIGSVLARIALQLVQDESDSLGVLGEIADGSGPAWSVAAYFVPFIVAFVAFLALYAVVPSRLRSPRQLWPGALVSAVLFQAAGVGFNIYLNHFSEYNIVFGALGAVAVFLFWVYLVACITLFGAEVAAEYPRARGEQAGMPGLSEPLPKAAWSAARGLFVRNSRETGVADERGHEGPPADG